MEDILDNDEQYGRPRLKRKPLLPPAPGDSSSAERPEIAQPAQPISQPVQETKPVTESPKPTESIGRPRPGGPRPPRSNRPDRPERRREYGQRSNQGRPRDQEKDDRRPRPDRQDRPTHQDRPAPAKTAPLKLSVVIPAYNEEGNIGPLLDQFKTLYHSLTYRAELILVDDGSTDKTGQRIKEALLHNPWLKVFTHRSNRGLTAALETGISKAGGKIICFYPADLQYHANEIPRLVAKIDAGADIATGWKQGNYGLKSVGSFFYNLLSRILFRVKVHDLNSVKAFTREVADSFIYRRGWHRYMAVMASGEGFRIDEVKVKLYPRRNGKSKFGIWRLPAGFLDLLSVKFQLSFTTKPLLFFGSAGLISVVLGFLTGLIAIYLRVIKHSGFRPLLYLVILLVVSGLLLFFGGFLAELIVSVKEDVQKRKSNYLV